MHLKNELLYDIRKDIEVIEKDERLYEEKHFKLRAQAIDDIEFHIIDRIDGLITEVDAIDQLYFLKQYATSVKHDLESIDAKMFHQLRTEILQGACKGSSLMDLIDKYFGQISNTIPEQDAAGYDDLDLFFNGLLSYGDIPVETKEREAEMVFYQKTPARIILELVNRAAFKPDDVFVDIGSGLGQVSILVHLLSGVTCNGVEFEPAFCSYANACAAALNLTDVAFVNTDARNADYSSGTVFFMYTPFEGKMLQDVLQRLKNEAKKRTIKIFTYGPCTDEVTKHDWLIREKENCLNELGVFIVG